MGHLNGYYERLGAGACDTLGKIALRTHVNVDGLLHAMFNRDNSREAPTI